MGLSINVDHCYTRQLVPSVALVLAFSLCALVAASCGLIGGHSRLAMTTFNEVYETDGTRLDDCRVCHSQGRALNSYGKGVRNAIPPDAKPRTDDERALWFRDALAAIACDDSDGDGYENGVEIHVRTFPGNEKDAPTTIRDAYSCVRP